MKNQCKILYITKSQTIETSIFSKMQHKKLEMLIRISPGEPWGTHGNTQGTHGDAWGPMGIPQGPMGIPWAQN